MVKEKIAIAIDGILLKLIDSKVGTAFTSRSQAIDHFLRKGLHDELLKTAVLMLKGDHQEYSMKKVKDESLLGEQVAFLKHYGIKDIHIVTQRSKYHESFRKEVERVRKKEHVSISVHEKEVKGNAEALSSIRQWLTENFVVMGGDLHMHFNLRNMIKKHLDFARVATMGLMMRDKPVEFGNAVLDGDLIVNFIERPSKTRSYAVNAGIYVFSPQIFDYIKRVSSLEREVFPRLATDEQLVGHFTLGEYRHMEEG